MGVCDWCGKNTEHLEKVRDQYAGMVNICEKCKESKEANKCIRCGCIIDYGFKGKCMNCYQIEMSKKQKEKEEVLLGLSTVHEFDNSASVEFSDEEYEQWMTMGNTVSPSDIKKDPQLRRVWIIVKLSAAGLDMQLINKYAKDVEELLDSCFTKLINSKCKIVIANTSENKKIVKSGTIIDYKNEVYIMKA